MLLLHRSLSPHRASAGTRARFTVRLRVLPSERSRRTRCSSTCPPRAPAAPDWPPPPRSEPLESSRADGVASGRGGAGYVGCRGWFRNRKSPRTSADAEEDTKWAHGGHGSVSSPTERRPWRSATAAPPTGQSRHRRRRSLLAPQRRRHALPHAVERAPCPGQEGTLSPSCTPSSSRTPPELGEGHGQPAAPRRFPISQHNAESPQLSGLATCMHAHAQTRITREPHENRRAEHPEGPLTQATPTPSNP